jgi:intracellular sulfur oxidation DsrE/DsrF family protein
LVISRNNELQAVCTGVASLLLVTIGIKFIVCTIILDLLNGEEKKLCENFTMVKSTCTLGLISKVTSSTRH